MAFAAAVQPTETPEAQFTLQWDESQPPAAPSSLSSMLASNRDDEVLCAWLRAASVGNEYRTGGAEAACVVRRVA